MVVTNRLRRLAAGVLTVLCCLVCAACTSGRAVGSGSDVVSTAAVPSASFASSTAGSSTAASSTGGPTSSAGVVPATPVAAATVAGVPPSARVPAGFTEATCPYIDTTTARDLEGNRIYRTAVSTAPGPVTCRFYFWCCDYHATLEIQPVTYPSADAAYNAMVLTGRAGRSVTGIPGLVPGVDAVLYQTPFYGPDKGRDWACAFAKGTTVVVVRTDQTDVSFNARRIATAIAPKF